MAVVGNPIIIGGSGGGGGGFTPADEGKVVSNGSLVAQTSLAVTENDTYDTTLHDEVIVNVAGGGGVAEISRSDWNALTTAQKQAYGLVAIVDYQSGFIRGEYVNGAEYVPLNVYIPYSNISQVLCEAYLDNFNPLERSWGFGNSPVILTNVVSENNGAVSIPVKTDGTLAYVDLGEANTTFTVYVVMKLINPTNYSRVLSAMASRSAGNGMMLFGSSINVSSWASDTSTGISSTDFFVAALQYRTGSGSDRGLGIVRGGNFITKSPTTAGRYITIGRTDIDPNTSNAEPCDCLVKYIAVVANDDSQQVISNNLDNLYDEFVAS